MQGCANRAVRRDPLESRSLTVQWSPVFAGVLHADPVHGIHQQPAALICAAVNWNARSTSSRSISVNWGGSYASRSVSTSASPFRRCDRGALVLHSGLSWCSGCHTRAGRVTTP